MNTPAQHDADNVRRAVMEDGMGEPVTFLASFPPIQSAIKVGQDGARVQLDIPETEMPAIVRLMLMRGMVIRVTMEPENLTELDDSGNDETAENTKREASRMDIRRAAKRRNKRAGGGV